MKSASRLLAAALAAALLLRLGLLLLPTTSLATKALEPTGDSPEYLRLATNLVHRHIFSQDSTPPFRPDILRTPVYPAFLALPLTVFGNSLVWPVLMQILLSLAAVWLTFRLALELGLAPVTSAIASLLVALSPNLSFYSVKLTTEMLFLSLLLATLLLVNRFRAVHRWQELLAAGLSSGLLILTRPIAVFFPVLLALYVLWLGTVKTASLRGKQGLAETGTVLSQGPARLPGTVPAAPPLHIGNWHVGIRNCCILLACVSIVLAPWVVRNGRISGGYTVSTAFDYNIFEYTGALTLAAARLIPVEAARDSLASEAQQQFGPLDEDDQGTYWATMARVGWQQVYTWPLLAAKVHAAGSAGSLLMPIGIRALRAFSGANLLARPGAPHVAQQTLQLVARGRIGPALALVWNERLSTMPWLAVVILIYAVLFHFALLFAFIAALFLSRSRRLLWLLLPILYFVVTTGPVGEARFRVPIEPLLCLFAAVVLTRVPRPPSQIPYSSSHLP